MHPIPTPWPCAVFAFLSCCGGRKFRLFPYSHFSIKQQLFQVSIKQQLFLIIELFSNK